MPVDRTGSRFGPYRLEERLGAGGMGEVYLAFDTRRERSVAIKLMRADLAGDENVEVRFRREARTAARLSSPHIVPIHDFGEIEGQLFLDMRFVDGPDLHSVIAAEGSLAPARAVAIVRQIAHALDAAHAEALVHRDVKPSNVVVTRHGADDFVYLVDFGIVRSLDGSAGTSLTETGFAVGSLAYMAPELFTADDVDQRVDIYALGCVLFETLTGRPPFTGQGPRLMYDHVHTTPPRVSDLRPGTPPALDAVVSRALAKDPARRHIRAGELAEDARAAIGRSSPVDTPASGPVDRPFSSRSTHVPRTPPPDAPPAGAPTDLATDTDVAPDAAHDTGRSDGIVGAVGLGLLALAVVNVILMFTRGAYLPLGASVVAALVAVAAAGAGGNAADEGRSVVLSAAGCVLFSLLAVALTVYGVASA